MTTRRTSSILGVLFLTAALGAGCAEKDTRIEPEPGSGGTGAGGDAGADAAKPTACPTGLPGPKLVALPAPDGSTYCMDQREVVNSEYQDFLKAVGGKLSDPPPECSWNTALVPELYDPTDPNNDDPGTGKCSVNTWNNDPSFAVVCVDFCDAWAYCSWAGKRLCGVHGAPGNSVNVMTEEQASAAGNSTASEWFNACTQGGTTKFPYGDAYVASRCVDDAKMKADGLQARSTKDTTNSACHGTKAPFDEVYHLSGNAKEWLNICRDGGLTCASQGGDRMSPVSYLECATFGSSYAGTISPFYGFRCCADPVAAAAP